MGKVKIGTALRERLQAQLPEGYNLDDLRLLECRAQFQSVDGELEAEEQAVVASIKEAGPALMTDGKPTIMRVVAWMCHGDIPNKNRDAFVKEELQSLAPALFRQPNFGVMDFNHSAVIPWSDDPKVIGVWYKAEYAFDQAANEGKGAWGVLATGMMFAWAFPEQANALLGEQGRSGFVAFSMAATPGGITRLNAVLARTDISGRGCDIIGDARLRSRSSVAG